MVHALIESLMSFVERVTKAQAISNQDNDTNEGDRVGAWQIMTPKGLLACNDRPVIIPRCGSSIEESLGSSRGVPRLCLEILYVTSRYSLDALESYINS
ncbi:hypothetical protein C4D60_Mb08t06340 [Musa balbisiana]|uniref:Uncharacterized protein n=1 Tax=Musa balbisiana TaxID=52838 RepID=A0A4S8K1R3_MUSBA|nr:hypothetical protein C4D60_Mb08t06340 [Musa balbisiana]